MGTSAPRAPLDKSIIASALSQYWRVSVLDLTTSTQSELADMVRENSAKSGDVIAAEFQTAGRGRMDRTFEAPKSSALLFSLYITPTRDRGDWGFITHLAALTMQQVISVDLLSQVSLKWPNDILIGDAKVAGLLAQAAGEGIILGIGINVSMTEDELPVSSATSIAIAGSSNLNRNLILSNFLMLFESNFKKWDEGQDFIESYSRNCSTIGQNVRVEVAGRESRTGKALAINQTGALILEDGFEVNVGDVVHLR